MVFLALDYLNLIVIGQVRKRAEGRLAKVARDAVMKEFDLLYPVYGLASNKGYATRVHLEALRMYGPSPQHRFSFAPVRNAFCWAATATQEILPLPSNAEN